MCKNCVNVIKANFQEEYVPCVKTFHTCETCVKIGNRRICVLRICVKCFAMRESYVKIVCL